MKYKLTNTKTKEEHLCDKVTIDGFDYYVSDEEINNGDWVLSDKSISPIFLDGGDLYLQMLDLNQWCKVIATTNPNIDIPKVVNEVWKIAKNYVKTLGVLGSNLDDITSENLVVWGYNKSQETRPFSEEDMIEFSEWKDYNFYQHIEDNLYRTMQARPMYKVLENKSYTLIELIELWKEQQSKIVYYE